MVRINANSAAIASGGGGGGGGGSTDLTSVIMAINDNSTKV